MVARTLFLFTIAAVIIAGFVFLAPLGVVLKARGYTPEQISAMKVATEPQPDTPCVPTGANASGNAQTGASGAQPAPQAGGRNTQAPAASAGAAQQTPPPPSEPEPEPAARYSASDTINVRAGQGTNFDIVGQLDPGEVVTAVEEPDGDWMKIEGKNVTGWVYTPLFTRRN